MSTKEITEKAYALRRKIPNDLGLVGLLWATAFLFMAISMIFDIQF